MQFSDSKKVCTIIEIIEKKQYLYITHFSKKKSNLNIFYLVISFVSHIEFVSMIRLSEKRR